MDQTRGPPEARRRAQAEHLWEQAEHQRGQVEQLSVRAEHQRGQVEQQRGQVEQLAVRAAHRRSVLGVSPREAEECPRAAVEIRWRVEALLPAAVVKAPRGPEETARVDR